MKKILEYRVFDILKNSENQKFLDKVKKENPNLYSKFLNLVGNKGLQKTKEIYRDYEPEEVIKREKEEKKLEREEVKRQKNQKILHQLKDKIDEIENVLLNSELKTLSKMIFADPIINNFLYGVKKKYSNTFKKLLERPTYLARRLEDDVTIDRIEFYLPSFREDIRSNDLITIFQSYSIKRKKNIYSIIFSISSDTYWKPILKSDSEKEIEFLESRNDYLRKLKNANLSKEELYDIIFKKFKKAISDEIYLKWKEEYKLRKDIEKYNL